ncbi:MAG: PhoU family transcriptional regulator [Euryarchaeota archaeon]|nr:PhoU family transcriptional regulator [Euryarchaeota archaeon]
MLLEVKDTSELMIDLAYSSLLYSNKDIAEEVFVMEDMVDEMTNRIQEEAINAALRDRNVHKALAVVKLAASVEEISDAAVQIADIVLRDVRPHPVIQLSLRDSDVIITTARVSDASDLANKPLGNVRLASQCGMWVLAIKRERKYIYGPDKRTIVLAGDVLMARGPPDGEEYFKDLAAGKVRLEPPPA